MNSNLHSKTIRWQSIDKTSLMPADPATASMAWRLLEISADFPIISPHGHVSPSMLLANKPFESPTDLFLYHNHYITRLLHADGASLSSILKPSHLEGDALEAHSRAAWEIFASRYHVLAGTASGYWFSRELASIFAIEEELNSNSAERIYESILSQLTQPRMLPQQLFRDFQIELLATTDSPADDLRFHEGLAAQDLGGTVVPTFRPDSYLSPDTLGWANRVMEIIEQTSETLSQAGFVSALAKRRAYFIEHGAFSVDIGAETAYTEILEPAEAEKLFQAALVGGISKEDAVRYRGHMISEMVRLSCEDGLVITLHVGVHRNHSVQTFGEFGPDTGHDIPISAEFVRNLHPVLNRYGTHPNLHLILFALDETTWSREIAPLAGFYSSVFVGAPWWFYDAPDASRRFRHAVTDTVGFYRGSGFIDDTRAFLSIPTRHEMSRRIDAAYLAELVQQGRLTLPQAERIAIDLVTEIPRRAFKL